MLCELQTRSWFVMQVSLCVVVSPSLDSFKRHHLKTYESLPRHKTFLPLSNYTPHPWFIYVLTLLRYQIFHTTFHYENAASFFSVFVVLIREAITAGYSVNNVGRKAVQPTCWTICCLAWSSMRTTWSLLFKNALPTTWNRRDELKNFSTPCYRGK